MSKISVLRAGKSEEKAASQLIEEYCESIDAMVRDDASAQRLATWVAFCDDHPAGCIVLRPLPSSERAGEIKRLFVRPANRGNGIAVRLLEEVEKFALESRIEWLYLDTTADMHQAQRLYARFGFEPCSRYNNNPQASIFMRKAVHPALSMREFQSGDEAAFCQLNEAWIEKYFKLEEKDKLTLRQPEKYILSVGGQIFMAIRNRVAVGCCALIPMGTGTFELSKMGVAESERGKGIGRKLLEYVIAEAKKRNITRLYLETNSKLQNAIHLYQSVGFEHLPAERVTPSPYQRANVYMELILPHGSPARD